MAGNCGPVSRSDMFILGTAGLRELCLGKRDLYGYMWWGGGGHRHEIVGRQTGYVVNRDNKF